MDDILSFGYWLRRRRKALDLTQEELARRVGCAVDTIRKIEGDARRPSRQMAERLADLLEIASADRVAFLKAARAELGANRLPVPHSATGATAAFTDQRPLPIGTVTFLFTDIEGSTRRWEQHRDTMPDALARHDAIVRQSIESHQGGIFRTVGDAFCAAFARATDALLAALAAQRALHAAPWGATGPLRVRMALHTGAVEVRDGDYVGQPLNRIARLMAAGYGGQVLLSRVSQELVRDNLPPDAVLRDLGTHQLKDLSAPEQIYQLTTPDLPADFPPLKTLNAHATNLPAQPTSLIGREQEVAAVCTLLRRPAVRLLTLTGAGGIGKTRLGLQVAAELLDEFRDGVYFIALASLSDSTLVPATIAQTLGLRESASVPLHTLLHDYLRDKQLLLLLDNVEQISGAGAGVADLLTVAPRLKVLMTSRVALHLYGEHEYVVPALALPDLKHLPPLERLTQYEAVRLFIERSQASKADFAVTHANAPAIAEICARLDGLPLAIELAAARSKYFAPQALLARLEHRLQVLTGGAVNLPSRHQTLRNTIAWSYHLLEQGEQVLFRRLGVFVGGCALEAVEAVCNVGGDLPLDVVNGLPALVDKSLLQQAEGVDGAPRFAMLETIREYALDSVGRERGARRRTAAASGLLSRAGGASRTGVGWRAAARLAGPAAPGLRQLPGRFGLDNRAGYGRVGPPAGVRAGRVLVPQWLF